MTGAKARASAYGPMERPSTMLYLTEGSRAWLDLSGYLASAPLLTGQGTGDGHAVLVLPGFLADDRSTRMLRLALTVSGYSAWSSRMGRNLGPRQAVISGLEQRLARIHEGSGGRVSVIGWSLGGVFARYLAHQHPHLVRSVITLGTPHRLSRHTDPDLSRPGRLYASLDSLHDARLADLTSADTMPDPSIPFTSIYSRGDGIVPWNSCLIADGPRRQNVEVSASHLGMGASADVLKVVLDRLGLPEGEWRPYHKVAGHAAA